MQQRRERQPDANPRIRQWRESLLGMFVGGDTRAASNTSNGHLLMGKAAAGSGVSVNSLCQATCGDGKSIRFSQQILSREAKRPRTEARDGRDIEGDVNNCTLCFVKEKEQHC
jgi:hypothetical protein